LLLVPTKGEVCLDLDPIGCASLIGANSNLCHEEVFAHAACQRTCGLCSVTCYHCDDPVSNYQECNVTKSCNEG
ncbi:hypothetical protein MAR_020161, partial [Mya arenaria]